MSEPKLISPMLDNFNMGDPISDHHGVRCCPAMKNNSDDRYIVKIISVPSHSSQMDALLLTGAYSDEDSALAYFKSKAENVLEEVNVLQDMSELEGFIPYRACQMVPMEGEKGYDIYLLSDYKRTLEKHFKRHIFTHLDALNLGLDLCAALSVCRRSGYLYVALKPSNVFVTDQRLYRIGDLGFVRLSSLKYASLPEKYLSVYTPPEIRDAFSSLNTTMDIYAAGLILYQTYNGGNLPFNSDLLPGDQLPPPLYADYEMSEIILKACASNPDDRWQDPTQMGQAIIDYMQRNGANDTPIVPIPVQEPEQENTPDISQEIEDAPTQDINDELEAESESTESEQNSDQEDPENLSFLEEDAYDEDLLDEDDTDYTEVTEEVSEMLTQADELATADVPEPVVVPEYVDVSMPEPIVEQEEEQAEEHNDAQEDIFEEEAPEVPEAEEGSEEDVLAPAEKKKHHWLRNSILVLLILAILAGGYFFYNNYYLIPIEYITVEGNEDTLTVLITTDIDESLLYVICSDTYGNQIPAPVVNGKAVFTDLEPNTAYSIKVVASGFHRLTGQSSTAYSTPIQTNIVQFDAVNGNTDGSVILNFAVEGLDSDNWTVEYSTEGEEVRTASFTSHMVTLTGLTVDKEYKFHLIPQQPLYITGQKEITFTPRKLIKAENLQIVSCINGELTAVWSVPEGETVSNWSVHCSGDNYSQTIITSDTTATFQGLDDTADYKIEIKAAGMSVTQSVTIPAGSITASNFNVDTTDPTRFVITWNPSAEIPADGWLMYYSVVGMDAEKTIVCSENNALIERIIPNATYRIRVVDNNGNVLLGSQVEIKTGNAKEFSGEFSGISVTSGDLEFYMVRTPDRENWGRYDLAEDDYTTSFAVGESTSFLVRAKKDIYHSNQKMTTMYIVRNQSGDPILIAEQTKNWSDMWSSYNCKLEVPVMPSAAGTYTMEVYFNGGLTNTQPFTITQ